MAKVSGQRALYTNAKQAKHTFVSLGGKLEKTKDQLCKKTFLSFQSISAGGFLYKSGIRKGDRLISVNFFSTKDVPFDMLIETIRSLNPLALRVERTTDDGTVVAILVVMEILADKDKEPKLKFHGLYFSKDSESLDKDTIIKHIPIDVELMTTYRYDSSVSDVILLGQQDQSNYILTVDDTDITFKTRPEGPSEGTVYTETVNKC
ncbi:hypothetical protein HOLleu_27613 [Holothuria leucospilota]|uniref:PDZ domain-containing protein n=1 Tax=Holothuria leucospilota TaxID=206669 RepID=A0A9Q1H3L6_HOLLE|nr:hypothetical protein HOLleu_27613 [Holothuria leucospilota]